MLIIMLIVDIPFYFNLPLNIFYLNLSDDVLCGKITSWKGTLFGAPLNTQSTSLLLWLQRKTVGLWSKIFCRIVDMRF